MQEKLEKLKTILTNYFGDKKICLNLHNHEFVALYCSACTLNCLVEDDDLGLALGALTIFS